MINKEQLQNIAQKTNLPLYQQEKDYLLKLFLFYYYNRFQDAVFKGGTCLKYLLGIPRFSEDLDFNISRPAKFKEQVRVILQDFQKIAITVFFLKEEIFEKSYTCELGFHGPLYLDSAQTQNKFRIDAGDRIGTFLKPEWKLIHSEYPETEENFLVLTMNIEEMLVEKLIALTQRSKGRDLYDIWFIINSGIALNQKLLQKKTDKKVNWKIPSKQEYERDMSRLTSKVIPYTQVKKEVEKILSLIN